MSAASDERGSECGSRRVSRKSNRFDSIQEDAVDETLSTPTDKNRKIFTADTDKRSGKISIIDKDTEKKDESHNFSDSVSTDDGSMGPEWQDRLRYLVQLEQTRGCPRTPMGEYIPPPGGKPLTQLAVPTPGAADYFPAVNLTKPKQPQYSITGRPRPLKHNNFPGPLEYNTSKNLVWKKKTITIKGKTKSRAGFEGLSSDESVGPASYNVTHGNLGTSAPKYKIGRKVEVDVGPPNALVQPVDTLRFDNPSPARYRPSSGYWDRGVTVKGSFGLAIKEKSPVTSPGPAEYNVPRDKHRGPAYSFGSRLKPTGTEESSTPGPGTYEIGTTIGKSLAKSVSGRNAAPKNNNYPSPNTYNPPSTLANGPKHSMTYRPFETKPETRPGPSEYSLPKVNLPRAPQYSCRQQCPLDYPYVLHHWKPHTLVINPEVGPDTYDPNKDFSNNDAPAYSMGKRFGKKVDQCPGPASYYIKTAHKPDANRSPAFPMGKRIEQRLKREGPGPAAYYPKVNTSAPSYSMGRRNKKIDGLVSTTPAPNAYQSNLDENLRHGVSGVTLKGRPSPFVYSGFKSRVKA